MGNKVKPGGHLQLSPNQSTSSEKRTESFHCIEFHLFQKLKLFGTSPITQQRRVIYKRKEKPKPLIPEKKRNRKSKPENLSHLIERIWNCKHPHFNTYNTFTATFTKLPCTFHSSLFTPVSGKKKYLSFASQFFS